MLKNGDLVSASSDKTIKVPKIPCISDYNKKIAKGHTKEVWDMAYNNKFFFFYF